MGAAGGPNMVEDGLVFYYDTGNRKSYAGEPATNSQDPDYAAFTQAGFDAWGCYDGGSPAHTWDVNQSKTYVSIPGPDSYPVDAMLYHNFTGGFHGPTHWSGVAASLLTNGSKVTLQGWVKAADAASVGKTVRPYLYYTKIGGGAYSSGTSYALTSEWQLVSHSYTVPEGSTGNGTMYFFTSGGTNIKMHLTKTAIVGGKLHAVQWLPGNTTRSATEGLKDLTNSTTLDLSTAGFGSSADLLFDGSNDYVQGDISITTETITVEQVLKSPMSDRRCPFGLLTNLANTSYFALDWWIDPASADGEISIYTYNGSGYSNIVSTGYNIASLHANEYFHIVVVKNINELRVYINGQEIINSSTWPQGNPVTVNTPYMRIGTRTLSGTINQAWQGELPITKIYNRALTAEEVQNNFNGIRSRFGI